MYVLSGIIYIRCDESVSCLVLVDVWYELVLQARARIALCFESSPQQYPLCFMTVTSSLRSRRPWRLGAHPR